MGGHGLERPHVVAKSIANKQHGQHSRRVPLRQGHREKHTFKKPLWAEMVTQTLPRRAPLAQSAAARLAVTAELAALREELAWDEKDVMELEDATRLHPNLNFSNVLLLSGSKTSRAVRRIGFSRVALSRAEITLRMEEERGRYSRNLAASRPLCLPVASYRPVRG